MKTLTACATLALALAVSGCGDTSAPNAGSGAVINISNPGSDQLKALSPLNQRIGLWRAIRGDGKSCRRVIGLGYQEQHGELAMWVALCDDGRNWAVFIAPSEDVQVRNCTETVQLGLPRCRPVAPLPPDPGAPVGTEVNSSDIEAANRNLTNAQ